MKMKRLGVLLAILALLAVVLLYPIDTYISKPGGAYELSPFVKVQGGDEDDVGTFSLMTISVTKATPAMYVYSKFSDYQKLLPAYKVRRHGENDKDYTTRQKKLMSDSQYNAIYIAYKKTGFPLKVDFDGIFVMSVLPGGAADGKLEVGDKIRAVDGVPLKQPGQFASFIADKGKGDDVHLTIDRKKEEKNIAVTLEEIPDSGGRVGLGIQFQEDRTLITDPKVEFNTSDIGGPSAGLMFTLEIMNQLLDEDLTKGYKIAGTGEMLEDGTVGRIGGADFKVVAADRKGVEIFFAPDDDLPAEVRSANPGVMTNYEEAVKMAEKIGTKMKIVPVKTIDDALDYLDSLEAK
ncbi:SepM family pheromone-processing serine protease [Sporosarcina sp. 179-K 3D1 HS]|uniref:SepM family pheromone-processing serine protease n=1 Tax=Sporosarcina sp. 179-K 3D1 HS TaxID=3232169 RepID=UPI0039A040CD